MTSESKMPERDAKEHERTEALPRLLSLGYAEIGQGKFRDAEDVFSELDKRIAEDEARPDETIAWEKSRKKHKRAGNDSVASRRPRGQAEQK